VDAHSTHGVKRLAEVTEGLKKELLDLANKVNFLFIFCYFL
jgi:hypothetical protein